MVEFIGFFFILISIVVSQFICEKSDFRPDKVYFEFYNKSNEKTFKSNLCNGNLPTATGCRPNDNLSIIVHGWRESCNEVWIKELIKNLHVARKGCIVCMNYNEYSKNSKYAELVANFDDIAFVLMNQLRQFNKWNFKGDNIFMFGFSFGGQLVLEAGRRLGKKRIARIDTCDSAGIGFDSNTTYSSFNPMEAAKFVQCIHTTNNIGTKMRKCHQNWAMGNCGINQTASGPPPKIHSHLLCPFFYNSAFQNKFISIPKPDQCEKSNRPPPNISMFTNISMGYYQPFQCCYNSNGYDYYANTYKSPPYNKESPRK